MHYEVYKVANTVNSKLYIGCTTLDFRSRFHGHITYALNENNPGNKKHGLHSAMRELGTDKFLVDLIEAGEGDNKHVMFARESYWIRHFSSAAPNGYNARSRLLSDEQIAIIRFDVCRLTQKEYARLFGVCDRTIAVAKYGRGSQYRSDPYVYITRDHLPENTEDYMKQFA